MLHLNLKSAFTLLASLAAAAGLVVGGHGLREKADAALDSAGQAAARVTTEVRATVDAFPAASEAASSTGVGASQESLGLAVTLEGQSSANASAGAEPEGQAADTEAADSLKVAAAIAEQFDVAVSDVIALHESGWGYGEIAKLYALAQASGKTAAEIKAMRDGGLGWGAIAGLLQISLGSPNVNLGTIVFGQIGK